MKAAPAEAGTHLKSRRRPARTHSTRPKRGTPSRSPHFDSWWTGTRAWRRPPVRVSAGQCGGSRGPRADIHALRTAKPLQTAARDVWRVATGSWQTGGGADDVPGGHAHLPATNRGCCSARRVRRPPPISLRSHRSTPVNSVRSGVTLTARFLRSQKFVVRPGSEAREGAGVTRRRGTPPHRYLGATAVNGVLPIVLPHINATRPPSFFMSTNDHVN